MLEYVENTFSRLHAQQLLEDHSSLKAQTQKLLYALLTKCFTQMMFYNESLPTLHHEGIEVKEEGEDCCNTSGYLHSCPLCNELTMYMKDNVEEEGFECLDIKCLENRLRQACSTYVMTAEKED